MNNVVKAGIYIRVASVDEARESYSLKEQRECLLKYCTYKGYHVYTVYADIGFSADNTDRPEFKRMMEDVKAGNINAVLVYKLDHLIGSVKDMEAICKELNEYGCSLTVLI